MKILRLALSLLLAGPASLFAAFPTLYLKPVVLQQFHSPTNIVNAGDGTGRLFVADQPGKIYVIESGMMRPTPFLDITDRVIATTTSYSERGLLGLAFHPGYGNSASPGYRKFYVYYSRATGLPSDPAPPQVGDPVNHIGVLSEFQVSATNAGLADSSTERKLMEFTEPQSNHNGGQLEFGPESQGYLYFSLGDGGGQNDNEAGHSGGSVSKPAGVLGNSQDRTRLFGKIIRIDPLGTNGPGGQYGIPADNPFVGAGGGIREEIWSFGMRNPWRFCFDKRPGGTNRMFCADVGQNKIEEIDLITKGGNYGWRIKEGTFDHDATAPNPSGIAITPPIAQYAHPGASGVGGTPQLGLSVTGGFVYRGTAIPALQGKYLFGDYGSTSGITTGRIMGLEETAPGSGTFTLTNNVPLVGGTAYNPTSTRILCFGEDENGEIYVGTKVTGGVQALDSGFPCGGLAKIVAAPVLTTVALTATKDNSMYSELGPSNEELSNGTGDLFAGRIANGSGYLRRALLAFNPTSLPPRTTVVTAQLGLTVNLVQSGNSNAYNMTLHKVSQDWGEGSSFGIGTGGAAVAPDASWTNRIYPATPWTTAGGSFTSTASATASVGVPNTYNWSSPQLAADAQSWRVNTAGNFGWILRGDENTDGSAKRINSRESGSSRPTLTLGYVAPSRWDDWLTTYYPSLLIGGYINPIGDDDGDGINNMLEYAYAYSPLAKNVVANAFTATPSNNGSGTDYNVTFRRDPRATDLTYELQATANLSTWTTIVTSAGGTTPTGSGFVSEATIPGESPVKLVTAKQVLPTGADSRSFLRLKVTRTP